MKRFLLFALPLPAPFPAPAIVIRHEADAARSRLPTSAPPAPAHGLRLQDEAAVDIDPGKTLLISLQSVQADHEAQEHKVQFELNGQSRMVHVPMRHADGEGKTRGAHKRAKADPANALHVAAPRAGGVVSVAVKSGQKVKAGDALLALEAMKMETHLNAERDAEIEQVLVHAGDQIDAKDLLVVFKP